MKHLTHIIAIALSCAVLMPAQAAPPASRVEMHLAQKDHRGQQNLISPKQAARRAQKRFGGRVLSVRLQNDSRNPQYAVKLIRDGQVKIIYIPARN